MPFDYSTPTLKLLFLFCSILIFQQLTFSAKIISINDEGTVINIQAATKALFDSIPISDDNTGYRSKPTIMKNFIRRKVLLDREDIVLGTHITTNKLNTLITQLKYWKGPASVAIYISSKQDIDEFFNFRNRNGILLRDTSFHFVLEKTTMAYPHNILRNVAIEAIESDYFVALDADFIPMPEGCHDNLISMISKEPSNFQKNGHRLFILPAFQLFPKTKETLVHEERIPRNKAELADRVCRREVQPSHVDESSQGHIAANYSRWLENLNTTTEEDFYDVLDTNILRYFEPFVVGYRPGIPRYWEGELDIWSITFLIYSYFSW
jgi:hypothetical protein